jgi:uncharacterized protein
VSDWIATYTGKKFVPLDPRVEDIDIRDIAHALANVCRFSGHVSSFYSVAQHSVLAAEYASPDNRLGALLHDASEAYICDMSRPVKHDPAMQAYRDAEKRLMGVIEERFSVSCDQPEIHDIDNRLLFTERRDLMPTSPEWGGRWGDKHPYPEVITPWTPIQAKTAFLEMFYQLTSPAAN